MFSYQHPHLPNRLIGFGQRIHNTLRHLQRPHAEAVPGPRWQGPLGALPDFMRDPLGLFQNSTRLYGDLVRVRLGPKVIYIAGHPDSAKHILQENHRNYIKERMSTRLIQSIAGENLVTGSGEFWLRQRRLTQPAFHRQRLAGLGQMMTNATSDMLAHWPALAASGHWVDVEDEMRRLTLRLIGQTLFSVDLSAETSELGQAFTTIDTVLARRVRRPLSLPLAVPTPHNQRLQQAVATIRQMMLTLIAERRRAESLGEDLLGMLMEVRDEDTGEGLSDEQLCRELGMLVGAGHETVMLTLTWALYLLARNPEAEQRLQAEIDSVLAGRIPTMGDLPNLPYTRQVIDETLRLYPPAWLLARHALSPDFLEGHALPAGADVWVSVHALHRDPRWWDDPDRFDPDRFTSERSIRRPKFAYLPFGGGPRLCIGQHLALAEAQLILAMVAQRYCLRLPPDHTLTLKIAHTLGPQGGMPMRFVQRKVQF